jgi:hypothetical protein
MVTGKEKTLYVLFHNNSIAILDTDAFSVIKIEEMKDFEA